MYYITRKHVSYWHDTKRILFCVKEAVKMSSEVHRGSTNADQRGVKRDAACCDGTARYHIDRVERRVDEEGPRFFPASIWDSRNRLAALHRILLHDLQSALGLFLRRRTWLDNHQAMLRHSESSNYRRSYGSLCETLRDYYLYFSSLK